ncbi:toll/interleukin-1 receptor domain-containing protein [Candidatus Parcubacteria bacterium]|nr:MAG: toll/interleukin-1 receptor domain-containing protein [Candidatus Parcubacteria bacterium]
MMRDSIFISHATPEDNEFVRWLGARLELAGFSVWHDLDRLKGGDYFWDKIEEAIRNESFRFLAVVSKVAVNKTGVKDEWALAQTLEKTISGFVIPLRLDDCDFSRLPIGIHRKNVVDFANGWHKGLAALLDTLTEADTPIISTPDPRSARHWLSDTKSGAILRVESNELLDSTWLNILSLPPIETTRILGFERGIKLTDVNRVIPWFEYEDRIVGFAKATDLVSHMSKSVMLKAANSVDSTTFIESGSTLGERPISASEARKHVANLVRQAWELKMETKGLGLHEQSGGRKVYFITPELTKGRGEKVAFQDVDGRKRRKALNGRSERKKANWCYGVGVVPRLDEPWRMELRATIVFTDDNGKPLDTPARSHRLRMSFCRSWWNDRWRGFLRAFLTLIAEGNSEIKLPVGSGREISLSATPIMFSSPVGLSDLAPSVDEDFTDEPEDDSNEFDDLDDDEIQA